MSVQPGDYVLTTDPVHIREADGKEYRDTYTFTEVHMDFEPEDVFPDDSEWALRGDTLFYKYGDKPPMMLRETTVWRMPSSDVGECKRQAYFLLSMLESAGFVTGWSKQ
jgi:hypothetical protein